jgi:hypothetical protein
MTHKIKQAYRWSPATFVLGLAIVLLWATALTWGQGGNFPGSGGLLFGSAAPSNPCANGQLYTRFTTGAFFTCNSNAWGQLTAGGGSIGSAGQSAYFSGANTVSGGTVVLDMAGIAGGDLGAIMNNCATALPATGGTCKGDNLTGALTLSSAVTTAKAVTYTFCGQAISQSAAVTFTNSPSGILGCHTTTTTFTKAGNITQFTLNANYTFIEGVTLAGVSGSFTGGGISVTSVSNFADVYDNVVAGEAGIGIQSASANALISDNQVGGATASAAISGLGMINFNVVTAAAGDGIDVVTSPSSIIGNTVGISIPGGTPTSNLCGINLKGDQIGNRTAHNQVTINDSNNADVNYGVCSTPTGVHNLNTLFEGDNIFATLAGGATAYGFFMNNAAGLNTNWNVTVRDIGCVHMTACLKRTDAQNNVTRYEDIQPGDVGLDAGTGSLNDVFIINTGVAFASLPNPAGAGSTIAYCNGCGYGIQAPGSGGSGPAHATGQNIWQIQGPGVPSVFASAYTNATTTASNITGLSYPIVANQSYAMECHIVWSPSVATAGLDITVTGPAAPVQAGVAYQEYTGALNAAGTPWVNFVGLGSKATGNTTVTVGTNFAIVTIHDVNGSNAGTLQVQGSATGVGTVTVFQESFCEIH